MPKFKDHTTHITNEAGEKLERKDTVMVDAEGWFYTNLPNEFSTAFAHSPGTTGKFKVQNKTFEGLVSTLRVGYTAHLAPEVREEKVIVYNFESHVSFAGDTTGNIYPNAGFEGADWSLGSSGKEYGGHHAASPAKGGYSLTVGAKVMIRRVVSFAGRESVSFRWCNVQVPISQIANHPDALLNSWVAFDLPDNARWIPYTDEAALFFHNVMNSIALLNKRIQTEFGNEGKLMKMLNSGAPMLPMLGA